MPVKAKRIAKKIAKNGAWAVSDIIFLVLKTAGTVLLIAVTTGVVFSCIFLIYLRSTLTSDLDVNVADFKMSLSSVICCIDPQTGEEKDLVTLQSSQYRKYVSYDEIPKNVINALVAIEDHRFFQHQGVDWYRTAGAFMNMFLSMRDTFGGSTITQQLIKNLTSEDDVTVQRKLQEIFRALEYEKQHSKEDILELYLNLVYFGNGCYGIGAAANYYFNTEVSDLTLAEGAAIIGITNNPALYSPYADRAANKTRQELILSKMLEYGYIDDQQYKQAVAEKLNFQRGENSDYEQVVYTWFEEAVIRDVIQDMINTGMSEQVASRRLYTGGLKIVATIDPNIQAIVDNVYQNPDSLPKVTGSSQQVQSGIVVADPYTGEIKALSGGVGVKTKNMLLNRATMTRRPPGSSLKPVSVYAPAMDRNLVSPDTLFNDSADTKLQGTTWMPKNADRTYAGLINLRDAIRLSLNTIAAVVLDKLTPSVSYGFMRDVLGFTLSPADDDYAPLAAGQLTNGATVREMASAFTIFPNGGRRSVLRTYSKVYDADGNVLIDNSPTYIDAISPTTAYYMTDMLYGVVTGGTGGDANLGRTMPTAGKTGTSTDSKDRWFVGFTPYYIAAVWTGFDTPKPMVTSGNPAAKIWKMIMAPVHEGLETVPFSKPDNLQPLPSVPGVAVADYTVRCIDTQGNVLQETTTQKAVVNSDVTVTAPDIDGYTLVGDSTQTISITNVASFNIAVFTYEPPAPETPDTSEPTGEPGNTYDPNNPSGPTDPNYPYSPLDPNNPGIPTNPYYPYSPLDPNNPGNTGNPGDANNPGETSSPGNTASPGDTGNPGDTGAPADTGNPGDTGSPPITDNAGDTGSPPVSDNAGNQAGQVGDAAQPAQQQADAP